MSWMLGLQGPPSQPENDNQRLLVDALAFRDQVMGILGHDLRNPLSAITALARVTMQRGDLPGDVRDSEALLAVTNRGPAIPADRAASLFQPFTHGDARPADGNRPRGLGLGLYIVKQIVTAHGGTITFESSAALGTTFIVRLPRRAS